MGITLSKKTLSKGRISLYLDCSIDGKRRKEYLGIILEVPTSKEIRKANREKIQLAQLIRSRREMEYLQSRFLIQPAPSTSTKQPETATEQTEDFFTFATNYLEEYKGKDYRVVRGMLRHLKEYHKPPLTHFRHYTPVLLQLPARPPEQTYRQYSHQLLQEIQTVPQPLRGRRPAPGKSERPHPHVTIL